MQLRLDLAMEHIITGLSKKNEAEDWHDKAIKRGRQSVKSNCAGDKEAEKAARNSLNKDIYRKK